MMVKRFSELFGCTRDNANLPAIAAAACREGYAVLPVHPNSKRPMCTLTPTMRKREDKRLSEAAKAAGHRGWMNVRHSNSGECGVHHAITDPAKARSIFARLLAEHSDLNIALEVGRSRMLCVDADNAADVERFTALWAHESRFPALAYVRPTVSSPGVKRDGDTWVHKDGGHFWFDLPEGVHFDDAATATGLNLDGAQVYFKDRVLLVPPSVREEGPYVLHSDIGPAPQWLIDAVTMHVDGHAIRREMQRDRAHHADDPIDAWAADTPWASLLEPDGWTQAHKFDACQCEIWSRPGDDWSSPKSATAHEPGCTAWDTEGGNGFLHLWTDNPPDFLADYVQSTGKKSITKLQYVALRDHEGDFGAAMRALDIGRIVEHDDPSDLLGEDDQPPFDQDSPAKDLEDPTSLISDQTLSVDDARATWKPVDWTPYRGGTYEPPKATLLVRTDGQGLFYPGRVHWVQGEPESGKSWLLQLAAAQVIATGGTVLYVDYEQDAQTIWARLTTVQALEDHIVEHVTYVAPEISARAAPEEFAELMGNRFSLAVIDGVTDALGTDGKSLLDNDEVARWMRTMPRVIARQTGAAVACVDHVVKDKDGRGRYALGAQAKLAGVDGASYIVEPEEPLAQGKRGLLVVRLLKDRYGDIRAHAGEWRKSDRSQEAARVEFDGTAGNGRLIATVMPPLDEAGIDEEYKPTDVMERVSLFLEELSQPVSTNTVVNNVTGKRETIIKALELLRLGGFVEIHDLPRNATGYTSINPFRRFDDGLIGDGS